MKKIISTILSLLAIATIIFIILAFLGFFKKQKAGILIESEPRSKVLINNELVGETPYDGLLDAGVVSVKVIPDLVEGVVFDDYETKIKLVPGVKTIIKRSFNQNEDMASIVIVSFEEISKNKSEAVIVTNPTNSQVIINQRSHGYTPLSIDLPEGEHNLVISANEYKEKSLPVKIYKGYKLTAYVKLAKEGGNQNQEDQSRSDSNDTVKPLFRIKIKNNSSQVIDIKSGANIGFPKIGEVKEGEEYDVIEEGEGGSWYKIILTSGQQGWIPSEVTTKLQQSNYTLNPTD